MSDSINFDANFMLDFADAHPGSATLAVLEGLSRQERFALIGEMYFPDIPDDHLTQVVFGYIMARKMQQQKTLSPVDCQTPAHEMDTQPSPQLESLKLEEVITADPVEEVITADPVKIAQTTVKPIPLPRKVNYATAATGSGNGWKVVKSRRKPTFDYKVMSDDDKYQQCLDESRPMSDSWKPTVTSAFYVLEPGLIPQDFDTHLHDMEETQFTDADGNTVTHQTPIGWYYDGCDDDFAYYKTKESDRHFWELNLETGKWRIYTLDDEDQPFYHKPHDIIGRMLRNKRMHRLCQVDYIAQYLRSA